MHEVCTRVLICRLLLRMALKLQLVASLRRLERLQKSSEASSDRGEVLQAQLARERERVELLCRAISEAEQRVGDVCSVVPEQVVVSFERLSVNGSCGKG